MVQIVGKYQYASAENFEEYIKSFGRAEVTEMFLRSTPLVEIQQNGDQWSITVTNQGKSANTATFKLGETYDELLPSQGVTLKSVTTKEGDNFRTETTMGTDKSIRIYEFTDTGMIVHLSSTKSDIKAKRIYKRV
ncbi:hypothetical protein DMN91_005156 [Ooceraea biroi]|uniref:Lipocalin/cytosolic fatty-acid binding domain-containing protein n=2 Tax=Ooceraea biroi TaxID=2015173 RepID=A0A3L8DSY5_OOCBI|nr:fatty acid-binding protein 9 [Ooceraea biroi]RLU22878.1 hypothetical protein DMN91_005156 [Ooceraea biroi]